MGDLLGWWYSDGWSWSVVYFFNTRNRRILEYFSVKEIVGTLFAPYRQTFAGSVQGSIGDKFRGLIDNTVSRTIGFIVRLFLITTALILVFFNTLIGAFSVILWPVVPALPVLAIILMLAGFNNAI